jgi:divalent metal cation (Fe/Co/Zn/Cd) transporter
LGDRFEVDFHLQVAETATVAEGHAIAGRIKADILKSHPEVIAVLVHVEPDHPEHLKRDGHHGLAD